MHSLKSEVIIKYQTSTGGAGRGKTETDFTALSNRSPGSHDRAAVVIKANT